MVDYLKGVLEDSTEVITGRSTILAFNNIFKFRSEEDPTLLDKQWATASHHMVAHMLFVTSRSRKDINISIVFLCNIVRTPYEDD